ncbi:MAG: FecR domain-containing protein [Deltaproteobacteria bacterium]|nr:FecR domain-containing protein [Deltaproteobacteria bacterium]
MQKLFIILLIIQVFYVLPSQGSELSIGKIKTLKGTISAIRDSREIQLNIGDSVYQNDDLRTGVNSAAGIIFEDDTILSLGPQTELVVDEYLFTPEKGGLSMFIRMLRGTASYISGIIGHQSPESVKFQMPDAIIAIRGTHFLVRVKEYYECLEKHKCFSGN